jgi:hypothetical protein
MTVLNDQTKPTYDQLFAMLQDMKAKLAAKNSDSNGIKIHAIGTNNKDGTPAKGTVGVRVGRHSVVLYPSQWLELLDKTDDIRKAIEDHRGVLSWKE